MTHEAQAQCPQCYKSPCICWKLTQEKREAERIALEGVTLLERYHNGKARFAIWLDEGITINRWVFISLVWVASICAGYVLFSFVLGNLLECKVL